LGCVGAVAKVIATLCQSWLACVLSVSVREMDFGGIECYPCDVASCSACETVKCSTSLWASLGNGFKFPWPCHLHADGSHTFPDVIALRVSIFLFVTFIFSSKRENWVGGWVGGGGLN
jgi:hypothetical protein